MRIKRFTLSRFGHFTEHPIDFGSSPDLHVIFGGNEAGKTTALEAVHDLLFGFEPKSNFAFLHDYKNMLLFGEIENAAGQQQSFFRRKGNKQTLLNIDNEPLADHALMPFLGSCARGFFKDMFGLSQAGLRAGGRVLEQADGDVAEGLLGAAGGLGQAIAAVRHFDEQASGLFVPKGKKLPFNQLSNQLKAQAKQLNDSTVHPDTWQDLTLEHAALDDQRRTLDEESASLQVTIKRIERHRRIRPLISAMQERTASLLEFGDLPELDQRSIKRARDRLEHMDRLLASIAKKTEKIDKDRAERDALQVDPMLIEHGPAIEGLEQLRTTLERDLTKLPQHEAAVGQADHDLQDLFEQAGLVAPKPGTMINLPNKELTDRIKRLKDEAIDRQKDAKNRSVELAEIDAAIDAQSSKAAQLVRLNGTDLAALPGALDDLRQINLPLFATIEQFEAAFREQDDAIRTTKDQTVAASHAIQALQQELDMQATEGVVPSLGVLQEARAQRDSHWRAIQKGLIHASDPTVIKAEFGDDRPDASFERAVTRADQLADSRYHHAEKAAAFEVNQRRKDQLIKQHQELDQKLAQMKQARLDLNDRWREAWKGTMIEPLSPVEMKEWCRSVERIIQQQQENRQKRDRLTRAQAQTQQDSVAWRDAWSKAMDDLDQASSIDPRDIDGVLDLYVEIGRVSDTRTRASAACGQIQQDRDRFSSRLTELLGSLGHTDPVVDPLQTAADVYQSFRSHESNASTRHTIDGRIVQDEEELSEQKQELDLIETELSALRDAVGADDNQAMRAVHDQWLAQQDVKAEITDLRKQITVGGDGLSIEQLIQDLAGIDVDQEQVELERARVRQGEISDQLVDLGRKKNELEGKIQSIEAGLGAERAAQDINQTLAQMRDLKERYLVQKTASFLLNKAIDQVRTELQGPVVQRASRLFAELTMARFSAITVEYDDKDRPRLVGVRANGDTLALGGMSEGTQDQFFLALRLALVEQYIEGNEPLPFICDDLLVAFDDARAAAALKVLAALSQKTQVILFTHHAHMIELARDSLGDRGFHRHDLGAIHQS